MLQKQWKNMCKAHPDAQEAAAVCSETWRIEIQCSNGNTRMDVGAAGYERAV
jgi:hypothetical protein